MAEPIFLLGGGGHANDVLNAIERVGLLDDIAGCFDDRADPLRMQRWGVKYLGPLAGQCLERGLYVIGVGMPGAKAHVLKAIDPGEATALVLVDPSAMIGHGAELGEGTVVLFGGCVSALANIGPHCLIGHNSLIGHDTIVGARSSVMPSAAVSGDCQIGEDVLIGTNAAVLQGIAVGSGATVGAGALVTRDVAPGSTVAGTPARPITQH